VLWVGIYVALGVVSIGVLALLAFRLWRQVRDLGRQVSAASDRLAQAMGEMERIDPSRR